MRRAPVLSVSLLAVLLTACGQQSAESLADALTADPVRLKALRAQCAAHPEQVMQAVGEDDCRAAADAFRRRFFSGQAGPDEYRTLAELPPIPASFDEPDDRDETAALPALEDAP
ncbi:hypothetical protein [Achromobacter sp.]|uniref:hypothetical protein n=1 Tax=Achromobacter sp. TaxID=134375 RepID=UPI000EE23500|nr:hypothetical protein [Achromobacter sp.]HCW16640.1 hypothetical protein [Achromobacter sp.]